MLMDTQSLLKAAREQAGYHDLGDKRIIDALEQLINALNAEGKLSERGYQSVQANLLAQITNRLKIEGYLASHPELLERPVERPLFVFGLPRTGTTLAINLLNTDGQRRCFLRWESQDPVPPPQANELLAGPRVDKSQAMVDMSLKYAPHISAIHHEDAISPTECQFLMSPSFVAQYYDSMYDIPSYHEWFLYKADYLPAMEFHKRFLQLLQADAGGKWTLKNPWHPLYLNELYTVYPDAKLVMTHRDPVDVLGSACSLVKAVRPMFSEDVDLHAIGANLLETFDVMIERVLAYKERHGWDSIYDLQYADIMANPILEMQKLYEHFGEDFTEDVRAGMEQYMLNNPKGKHGKHEYQLEDYGLSDAQIRAHFADYCERFKIPTRAV